MIFLKCTKIWLLCLLTVSVCLLVASCGKQQTEMVGNILSEESNLDELSNASSKESSPAESSDVLSEDSGGEESESVDSLTYDEALALHEQDPDTYRDPGEKQPETQEMVQLENGQWYQSFVYSSYNCRCVFLSNTEYEMNASWDFIPIGSSKNAFLYNAGAVYDDPSGSTPYVKRHIAVRGTIAEGSDGYACLLKLPDELIVCVEAENGTCELIETEMLAITEDAPLLLQYAEGEVEVIGIVMRDENGVLYLKDADWGRSPQIA